MDRKYIQLYFLCFQLVTGTRLKIYQPDKGRYYNPLLRNHTYIYSFIYCLAYEVCHFPNTSVNIYMANKHQTVTPETHVNSVTG